jgi:hypothetical protein
MSDYRLRVLWVAVALVAAGCASGEEYATWKAHPTHFASGSHLGFSLRNRESDSPRVTREDIAIARDEGWWGQAATVDQEQILER